MTGKIGANAVDFAAKHHANIWGTDLMGTKPLAKTDFLAEVQAHH